MNKQEAIKILTGIRDEANLIDVIEIVCDCVAAGMARSGSVYDVKIPHDVLDKAIKNTVDMLISKIEVEEDE